MNLEREKENFKNHVATLTDFGNVKILDFKDPNSSNYRIRFLFEEDYYKLHISGDLGELTATNCDNMRYETFYQFLRNPGYFKEKVDCSKRPLYIFDEQFAREELRTRAITHEWFSRAEDDDEFEEMLGDLFDEVFEEYTDREGVSPSGYDVLTEFDCDASEWVFSLGIKSSGIVELYLLAFELAMAQIEEKK